VLPERASEVGELVQVRSRRWLVEDVVAAPAPGQSPLVRLSCADDDAQGQALDVYWDYELDRRILKEEAWADLATRGFDAPRRFAAFLHTLRWNCVTATDSQPLPGALPGGIKIDADQMEPPCKALRLPRVNLFIADDTGLSKTIEAGLIAREFLLRRNAKTIVVAAPPSVIEQWKAELEERFGLVFEILDRAYVARMRRERGFGVNPWRTHSRFLVSHKPPDRPDVRRPDAGQRRALRHRDQVHPRRARAWWPIEHRLFLSATTHNGHSNSFSTLFELLDPYRFTPPSIVMGRDP
jgi:hypothetical protein